MNSKKSLVKRGLGLSMAIAVVIVYSLLPGVLKVNMYNSIAYASTNGGVTIETIGAPGGIQGDENISVGFIVENNRGESVTVQNMKLTIGGTGVTVSENSGSVVIPSGAKQTVSFSVAILKIAQTGERTCNFYANLKDSSGANLVNQNTLEKNTYFTVYEKLSTETSDSKTVAAVDISHSIAPTSGFVQGNDNKLKIEFYNYGNITIKNAVVSLTLPEGLSIYNGSNQAELGYVSVGTRKTVEFPITVKDGIESKNYPIEVQILGLNFMNGDVVAKKTFYIPVEGVASISNNNISITNVNILDEVNSGTPFDLTFTIQNTGTSEVKNIKVAVEPAEGIINKSRNIFIDDIPKGGSKQYSVSLYSFENADEKTYPIKITAAPTNTSESNTISGVTQYITVMILSDETTAKKPQLMVDTYSYGGSAVQAGEEFNLDLGLFNTSGETLSNIKVSLSNADGAFVPVDGSNSFYIDSIKAKGHFTKSIRLTSKPQAEQKTTPITVTMSYEVGSRDPFEAVDTIAIPVTQKSRLVIDDIVPPMEIYVGQQGTCEVEFYNMGKTTLNNLRINCEGNFEVMESNSYYAGNMETGKSDSYRFNYIPLDVGTMSGIITFSFEDGNCEAQFMEVPFNFEVMEAPIFEEDPSPMEDEEKPIPWALIIAGVVVAIATLAGILFKKHRKKKMNKDLEIEDNYDINLQEKAVGETMDSQQSDTQ